MMKLAVIKSFPCLPHIVDPRQPCGSFPVQFSGTSSAFEFPAQNHTVEVGTECIYKTSTTPGSNLTVIIDQIRVSIGPIFILHITTRISDLLLPYFVLF